MVTTESQSESSHRSYVIVVKNHCQTFRRDVKSFFFDIISFVEN